MRYTRLAIICVSALLFIPVKGISASKANEGLGKSVSECKVDCGGFAWGGHEVCEAPDENNQAICPLDLALARGYKEMHQTSIFTGVFELSANLNLGEYKFSRLYSSSETSPANIRIKSIVDINNDGEYEFVGRKFHPDYLKAVGKKIGKGRYSSTQNIYDFIDIYIPTGNVNVSPEFRWRASGAMTNSSCVHARRVLPSDYNNDGFVDVFFACHGFDNKPFPGSHNVLYINNGDGSFKEIKVGSKGYYHGASSEDFNNDGYIDVIVSDVKRKSLSVLINNRGRGFSKATTNHINLGWGEKPKIYLIRAIDANDDGEFDLLLSGTKSNKEFARVYFNDGNNMFSHKNSIRIPKKQSYAGIVDIIAHEGNVYAYRSGGSSYWERNKSDRIVEMVQRFSLADNKSDIIYEHNCNKVESSCRKSLSALRVVSDLGKDYLITNASVKVPLN